MRPSDIVGALANEAGVPGQAIGAIDIDEQVTVVELPQQYQAQVLKHMPRTTIRHRPIHLTVAEPAGDRLRMSRRTRVPRKQVRPEGRRSHRPHTRRT